MFAMKIVLDQNLARSEELKSLLEAAHEIILIDDFYVEAFKSASPHQTLNANLKILRQYPNQVFVTEEQDVLLKQELEQKAPIDSSQLINRAATEKIRQILSVAENTLEQIAKNSKADAERRIANRTEYTERLIRDIARSALELMKRDNTLHEYTQNRSKRVSDIAEVAFSLIKMKLEATYPGEALFSRFHNRHSFMFAEIFSFLWRSIDWAIKGGFQSAEKGIKGDGFDLRYINFSSFFDGILSLESWLADCRVDMLAAHGS
jgi:hypothetical protein